MRDRRWFCLLCRVLVKQACIVLPPISACLTHSLPFVLSNFYLWFGYLVSGRDRFHCFVFLGCCDDSRVKRLERIETESHVRFIVRRFCMLSIFCSTNCIPFVFMFAHAWPLHFPLQNKNKKGSMKIRDAFLVALRVSI